LLCPKPYKAFASGCFELVLSEQFRNIVEADIDLAVIPAMSKSS